MFHFYLLINKRLCDECAFFASWYLCDYKTAQFQRVYLYTIKQIFFPKNVRSVRVGLTQSLCAASHPQRFQWLPGNKANYSSSAWSLQQRLEADLQCLTFSM